MIIQFVRTKTFFLSLKKDNVINHTSILTLLQISMYNERIDRTMLIFKILST